MAIANIKAIGEIFNKSKISFQKYHCIYCIQHVSEIYNRKNENY